MKGLSEVEAIYSFNSLLFLCGFIYISLQITVMNTVISECLSFEEFLSFLRNLGEEEFLVISHHRTNVPDSISSREWIDISPKQAGKLRKGRLIGVEGEGKRMATVEAKILSGL